MEYLIDLYFYNDLNTVHSWPSRPYPQILASSKEKKRLRQSSVELEYSPRQTYSLDTTYSFDMPLVLDINVATPINGSQSFSASFRTNLRDSAMDASAQVNSLNKLWRNLSSC